jgi:hypothetical protein
MLSFVQYLIKREVSVCQITTVCGSGSVIVTSRSIR